eukprot:CAMPEP_0206275504 /NCGR_PEP_ID=MMETSP0047_2-20121206/35794_1 /ASSEMBLY_ACC=CAM_ASM_000192 /TAXON_ID=195065 /ORGANISM="Chroomonas mesostigmatica_cf, Strain CCMP1168" /LENGTH=423 /DNA_ID=CAMNT_0053704931 /DNA_START=5 /DNA_END=1276 /DNA_ORIENTATION=+
MTGSERTVLAPMYMLEGFEPWKAAPWDDRTGQEPGGSGEWYDQSGAFYGPGGIAQRGAAVQLRQAGAAREQQLFSRGYGFSGLSRDQRQAGKLSSYRETMENQGELAKIVSPIAENRAENVYSSESRLASHRPLARPPRTLHMWDAGAMQSLPDRLRRREKLEDLKETDQRGGDRAAIFGARAARLQGLHEWDAGRVQELPLHLRRREKLMDMRENNARAAETASILGSSARAARLQGLHMWDIASRWQGLPDQLSRKEKLDDMKELNQRGGDMAAIFGQSNKAKGVRLQSLSQLNQGGQSSYSVERQETLHYMHDEDQINDEASDINGPLDEDEHKMGLKGQHTQMLHADIMQAFSEAKGDSGKRAALKQRLTMLCDEGRSHPQYWALKSELDRLDGGEDDSDTVQSYDDFGMAGLGDDDSF